MNNILSKDPKDCIQANDWEVPLMEVPLWLGKRHSHCIIIPVINEGKRIENLLRRMKLNQIYDCADIIIIDGGSTDGSLKISDLKEAGVTGLIVKTGQGKLSGQLRCGYAFALVHDYKGIVTIDGNDKDDPKDIPQFIDALNNGFDFIQGSRFIPGGSAENTPFLRHIAIRVLHAPVLSIASGFKWTDTTQGYRGYSAKALSDPRLNIFRDIFDSYELLAYLSYRMPKLGFKCIELPTRRSYPKGKVPTKISAIRGNIKVLMILFKAVIGRYNPKDQKC